MVKLDNVQLFRGVKPILENASLRVHSGWKLALIGANGAGKTSLFKLLLDELSLDQGEISKPPRPKIAHMAQEVALTERTALEYVIDGDTELRTLEQRLSEAERNHSPEIGNLHAQIEAIDGYRAPARAHQLLSGLGFATQDAARALSHFSGGWRIRLNLAQALMKRSELLLLDEPTNHLDLDAMIWLEGWLRQYEGTLILISHDRSFIDAVVDQVVHLNDCQLTHYAGNYSAFETRRAERLAQQQAAYTKQQAQIEQIEQFIRRFKAKASKAKQAQSRIKSLERLERISAAHIDSPFQFRFQSQEKHSSPLLSLQDADLGYGRTPIVSCVNLTLIPGQRIGLLGRNGAGKSTLVKSLVGDLKLLEGERSEGQHLEVGYFAQHQLEALDLQASALLHLQRIAPDATDIALRTFLGTFGFSGDMALDEIKHFSGGEKARLALALIAWRKPNLLLLDEPTNHLDMEVRQALTLALQSFDGTLILVSHDRHLLSNTVDQFMLIHDGRLEPFDGDLDDYHRSLSARPKQDQGSSEAASTKSIDRKEQKRLDAERRAQLRPLKKKIEVEETQIDRLSLELTEIDQRLSQTEIYTDRFKEELKSHLSRQAQLKSELEQAEERYLELLDQLEQLETELG